MALDFSDRSTPLDEVIDTSRPSIENEDGSFSTESTITVERDGRYYLVPSIVGGKRLSDEEAALAWYDGKNPEVGGFRSAEEAGTAAKRRSETIGKKRGAGKLDFSKHGTLAEEQPAEEATLTTAMSRGIGQVFQGASAVGVDVNRRLLDTMDRVDRGERVPELDDTLGYQHMGAEDRAKARAQAQGSLVRGAKGVAQHGQAMETLPQAPAVERLTKAKTYGEAWDAFASDPVTVVGHLTAQSLPASAPGLALAVAGGGAAALANASRATRVGAGAAGMGTGSAAIEYASSIVQAMQEAGINVHDPAALEAASADPELMRTVREKATAKAGVVGAFDAVSGGIASKVLAPARMASRPVARQAVNIAAQAPVQGALGAAGEAAGSAAAGEEVSPGAVAAEFLGEFGGAPAEVATMAASAGRQPAIAPAIEQPAAPVAPAPPARDPGVIDFEAPDLAAMRAENLESSPGASAPPPAVGNEIEFTAPDPLEAAASIEGAEAAELARQVDAARAVDFEQPAAGERMELAPSEPAAPAGNEIDIKAFLRERALERAKDLTLAPERAAAELTFADQAVETAGNMRAAVTRAAALTESTGVQHRARTVGGQWAVVKIGRDVEAVSISSQESEVPDARAVEDAPATPAEPAIPAQPTEPATPATPQEASAAPVVEAAVTSAAAPDFSAQATPELDHAAHQAATSPENELPEPTEAQREAGNYRKGHPKIDRKSVV